MIVPMDDELKMDLTDAAQVVENVSTNTMDIETVEILVDDRIATGG